MAHSDKNILITPNISSTTADPKIVFSGADASTGPQNITLQIYPTNSGTLSFEGSAGQLFSITNSMVGTIFSANDVSGIPSIEVLDTGLVKIAQYSGNVLIGTGTDNGIAKLQIKGDQTVSGKTIYGPNTTWGAYLQVGGNSREYVDNGTYASVVTSDGNLHLDAASGKSLYLNYYDGSTIYFGNGANGSVGSINTAGAMTLNSSLTVGSGQNSSDIYMADSDEGQRIIHCNSNRIGFLNQADGWGAYCDDAGNWFATNLSGTNTGDNPGVTSVAGVTPIVSSGGTTPSISHAASGVGAGTYNNVTVNTFGHVTSGSNVAYITGYSETDTLATVTARGATTSTASTFSGGLTASGSNAITLSNATGNYITSGTDVGTFIRTRSSSTASTGGMALFSGDSTFATGSAGWVSVNPGSSSTATGASLTLHGGNVTAATSTAGYVYIRGGTADSTASTAGTGGNVYIVGGFANATAGTKVGGSVWINGGLPINAGTNTAGNVNIGTGSAGFTDAILAGTVAINIGTSTNTTTVNGTVKLPNVGTSGFVKLGAGGQLSADTTVITSANYTSYSPSLTGGSASGTWGISISGTSTGVSMASARTDSTAYPVLWGTTGTTSQLYSCTAINIQSSTGTLNATAIRTTGLIIAGQAGFQSASYTTGRNRMWSFANADGYGLSYFQGTGGYASADSIGIHNGTATPAGCQFTFASAGNFIATGNVTAYGSPSDIRLKENVVKLKDSLSKVNQLNGYNYNYIGKDDTLMGVIAQEVEIVAPELVYEFTEVATGILTKAVRYEHISALLIEAIKEQQTIIDSQESRIARLEALVFKLTEGK